jgi:hypothetical protein
MRNLPASQTSIAALVALCVTRSKGATGGAGFGPDTYTLVDSSEASVGTLGATGSLAGVIQGFNSTLALADSGRDLVVPVVPEPSTGAIIASAGAPLNSFRRRRRSALH